MPITGDGRGEKNIKEKTPGEAVNVGVRSDTKSDSGKPEVTGREHPLGSSSGKSNRD